MIDRSRYQAEHAPTATELISKWNEKLPSSGDLASFFLNELCESSEHEFFLCNADVFLDVIERQEFDERSKSLFTMTYRLVTAAEFARGIADQELRNHFDHSIRRFSSLYQETANWDGHSDETNRQVCVGSLALQAVLMDDLPLARCILFHHHEMACSHQDCGAQEAIQCPRCNRYLIPYEYHRLNHSSSNLPGHPPHR